MDKENRHIHPKSRKVKNHDNRDFYLSIYITQTLI